MQLKGLSCWYCWLTCMYHDDVVATPYRITESEGFISRAKDPHDIEVLMQGDLKVCFGRMNNRYFIDNLLVRKDGIKSH